MFFLYQSLESSNEAKLFLNCELIQIQLLIFFQPGIKQYSLFQIDIKEELTYTSSSEDLKKAAQKESILKRIPGGAEATTVCVGAVEFLEQPTIAFVRLAEGVHMPGITEVSSET